MHHEKITLPFILSDMAPSVFFGSNHSRRIDYYSNIIRSWKENSRKRISPLCETSNIPLFINLKGYYPVAKKIEPYVSLSLGYAYNIDEYSGFYCDASIGIRLWKFCVGIGFIHHECTGLTGEDYYNNTFEDELWTRNKFQVKIGFQW